MHIESSPLIGIISTKDIEDTPRHLMLLSSLPCSRFSTLFFGLRRLCPSRHPIRLLPSTMTTLALTLLILTILMESLPRRIRTTPPR